MIKLGVDAIFLGNENEDSPVLVILNEDRHSLTLYHFEKSDHKYDELPRGNYILHGKIKNLHWTPLNNAITILYESYGDHLLRFSQNRIQQKNNFQILTNINYVFKMQYDEIVFHLSWQVNIVFISIL
jgi:hypothetical protein